MRYIPTVCMLSSGPKGSRFRPPAAWSRQTPAAASERGHMQVRTPNWDFSKVRAHWAQDHEFAQIQNAASTIPAYIEPYLVKVMVKAKAALDPKNERLHRELGIFIKQEMQHCKQHLRFNQALREAGYHEILPIEKKDEQD